MGPGLIGAALEVDSLTALGGIVAIVLGVAGLVQVLSRDVLLDRIWGYDYLGDSRLVDVAIQRLRAKIEADPATPELIHTVRGAGYKAVR